MNTKIPKHIVVVLVLIALLTPIAGQSTPEPYTQTFVLTAYYSPLPGQCCYVRGGLVADKILNGQGHTAADGTGVYPGMLAAPPTVAFGTRIDLPGLGIMTVHDRGGAIQTQADGSMRLDVWAGHGEEGLARALAFVVQTITGTVYPPGSNQPDLQFDLADLPAPPSRLQRYAVHGSNLMAVTPKLEDTGLSAMLLQQTLQDLGYFHQSPTGFYGEKTQEAFAAFLRDFGINAPDDRLTEIAGAHLLAAQKRMAVGNPISDFVAPESAPAVIAEAQRILRFLGYYRGRTNGAYDDNLFSSILKFQQDHYLVGTAADPGAGRIGPITMKYLQSAWNRNLVSKRAGRYLISQRVDQILEDRGNHVASYLGEGYSGGQVRTLQEQLAGLGFFPTDEINGNFGPMTKDAVAAFQRDRGILAGQASGYVGPETLSALRTEKRTSAYRLVRGQGWRAL